MESWATPKVALQGSSGSSVPLNFLHLVLGKDAFPSVTDRTLFYNTDDEMKKAIKQSQEHWMVAGETPKLEIKPPGGS